MSSTIMKCQLLRVSCAKFTTTKMILFGPANFTLDQDYCSIFFMLHYLVPSDFLIWGYLASQKCSSLLFCKIKLVCCPDVPAFFQRAIINVLSLKLCRIHNHSQFHFLMIFSCSQTHCGCLLYKMKKGGKTSLRYWTTSNRQVFSNLLKKQLSFLQNKYMTVLNRSSFTS